MKIAVLVSVGRHPVSGVARYSRNDAAALTMALTLAKTHDATHDATLDVLHAGVAGALFGGGEAHRFGAGRPGGP